MKYAPLIALAVVLIAIGPALVKNWRNAGKRKGSSGDAGPIASSSSDRDPDGGSGDSDGGGGD
ncbi:MAG: hypothetical protein RL339_66 [Pseudomonadota bacterium]